MQFWYLNKKLKNNNVISVARTVRQSQKYQVVAFNLLNDGG